MPNEKVVRLLQVKVLPQYRDEVLQAVRANKLPTRADKGVEVYYQTARKDDPNTLLFFAVFESQDAVSRNRGMHLLWTKRLAHSTVLAPRHLRCGLFFTQWESPQGLPTTLAGFPPVP